MSDLKIFKFKHTLNVFMTVDIDASSYEEAEEIFLSEEEYIEQPRANSHCFKFVDTTGEPNQNWEFIDCISGTYAFKQNFPVEQEIHIATWSLEEAETRYKATEFLWSANTSEGVRVSDMYEETLSKEVEVVPVPQNGFKRNPFLKGAADEIFGKKVGAV